MIGNNQNFFRVRKNSHNSAKKDIVFPKIDYALFLGQDPAVDVRSNSFLRMGQIYD